MPRKHFKYTHTYIYICLFVPKGWGNSNVWREGGSDVPTACHLGSSQRGARHSPILVRFRCMGQAFTKMAAMATLRRLRLRHGSATLVAGAVQVTSATDPDAWKPSLRGETPLVGSGKMRTSTHRIVKGVHTGDLTSPSATRFGKDVNEPVFRVRRDPFTRPAVLAGLFSSPRRERVPFPLVATGGAAAFVSWVGWF